ncbi:predicted protein [Sparassis crispa]|uniref:GYF domain-containing protein n=1 Tax=Sparassis crispa TaxID=139825 RepID=A0A401G8M1_9APHY|nr:predicted protein [Sparassis crispa]GBE78526.1 predicted protein [Sparassis crispa]
MMHFGPEWMRTKQGSRPAPSPPLASSPVPPGASTYSALVTPTANPQPERRDVVHPFRYSKEELLRIYKEGGGKGGLGLEVERWEGIVREVGCDPIGLKEMGEVEKKIFAGSLNSEIRRRQSTDYLSPLATPSLGDRPKLNHTTSGAGSPMRERLGGFVGRRRDSTEAQPLTIPRKLSLSSMQGPLASPRETGLPSPRTRIGQTLGFDGVLSESWSSRRRASDALAKPGGTSSGRPERDTSDAGRDSNESYIKEEEEGGAPPSPEHLRGGDNAAAQPTPSPRPDPPIATTGRGSVSADNVSGSMASLSLAGQGDGGVANGVGITEDPMMSKPPLGLTDLTSVEWSYLDPQGQIQGPFRADLMQRWHDEGYFSPNLLMKRTHLDSEWMSVGEMLRGAGSSPIFLTPAISSVPPPGLPRRPDPLLEGPVPDRDRSSPYQPVPTMSRRGSTLDSFMHSGPNSASASPASSFGAARFLINSPDPNSFDGRTTDHLYSDASAGSLIAGFAADPMVRRRATLNDTFDPTLADQTSYANLTPGRVADGLGFGGMDGITTSSADSVGPFSSSYGASTADGGSSSNGNYEKNAIGGHLSMSFTNGEFGTIGGFTNQSRTMNRDVFDGAALIDRSDSHLGVSLGGPYANGNASSFQSNGQSFPRNTSLQYSLPPDGHSLQAMSDRQAEASLHAMPLNQQLPRSFAPSAYAGSQSNWAPQEPPAFRRPGPFDPTFPTASNTVISSVPTLPQTPFNRALQTNQPPWYAASQGVVSDGWKGDPNDLTVANLGQHNQQQQDTTQRHAPNVPIDVNSQQRETIVEAFRDAQSQSTTAAPSTTPLTPAEPSRPPKPSRKASAPTQSTAIAPAPKTTAPSTAVQPPSPGQPVEHKPAWSMEDDKKSKPSGVASSLREIQEAETKKYEARKAAERERERAARAAAGTPSQTEEFLTFTTSWGLPTSQAGTARLTPTAAKESTGFSSSSNVPVWTNTPKTPVAKKTMKEIQEEEEKRKKQAVKEKETVAAAARRAYAETTNKPSSSAQPSGGAWTTVGTGGKTSSVTPAAVRPPASTSASTKVVPSTSAAVVATPPLTIRATVPATSSPRAPVPINRASSKADETPSPPSQEFLRWLSDSLKGLNGSVSYEEITSMLLSFPLDPDSSTVEIISDLIYASSTTLDGRRFASEFVSKRKADASSRPKGASSVGAAGKTPSIAEVVKAQPKPAQNEWGGFKVVNKKKKGGRA